MRVNGATDALAWEDTIAQWVNGLSNEGFCDAAENVEDCKGVIAWLLPQAIPLLVNQPRDWVEDFCATWNCA